MFPSMDWLQFTLGGRRNEGGGSGTSACSHGDSNRFAPYYTNPPGAPWHPNSAGVHAHAGDALGRTEWRPADVGPNEDNSGDEFEVIVEGKDEATIYKELSAALDDSFLNQKPSKKVLRAYLRDHGLAAYGRKDVLCERVKDYQAMKTIGCEAKYARSTFTIDCSSGICTNDVILFAQKVSVELGKCSYGYRFIAGRVTSCKYDTTLGRFACRVEVLWSTGHCAMKPFSTVSLTRNFPFQSPIRRQPWADEGRRMKAYVRAKRLMQRNLRKGAVRPGTAAAAPAAQPYYVDPRPHLVLPCVVPTTGHPAPPPMSMSAAVASLTGYQAPGHVLQPPSTDGMVGHNHVHRMPLHHHKSNRGGWWCPQGDV